MPNGEVKAVYKVHHEKLIKRPPKVGIDDTDLRIITDLYLEQTAKIRVEGEHSKSIDIENCYLTFTPKKYSQKQ